MNILKALWACPQKGLMFRRSAQKKSRVNNSLVGYQLSLWQNNQSSIWAIRLSEKNPPLLLDFCLSMKMLLICHFSKKPKNIKNVNIKQTKRKPRKSSFYREHSHCISFVYGGHESLLIRQQNVSRLESTYHIT